MKPYGYSSNRSGVEARAALRKIDARGACRRGRMVAYFFQPFRPRCVWGPGNNAVNCAFITSGLTSPAAQHAIVLKNIRQTQQTAQIVSDSGLISDMARANECSVAAARELKSPSSVTVGSVDPQFTLPVKRPCEKVGKYGAGHVSARSRGTSRRCVKKI